jgi:hypothetical protein
MSQASGYRGRKAHTEQTVKAPRASLVKLDSLLMLEDNGHNSEAWKDSLDNHFSTTYEGIGRFISQGEYWKRPRWSTRQYSTFQRSTEATDAMMLDIKAKKTMELITQVEKDIASYSKMYGAVKASLSIRTKKLLKEVEEFEAIEEGQMPLELINLIMHTVVTQSIGKTSLMQEDLLIRRWHVIKCGEREIADEFAGRAEQLWDALTAADHPEKPSLQSAIRYITKLLVSNSKYGAYVADVLNLASRQSTAAEAYAPSFAMIATAARNFVSIGVPTSRATGTFAYASHASESGACSHCGGKTHSDDQCWEKHAEHRPKGWLPIEEYKKAREKAKSEKDAKPAKKQAAKKQKAGRGAAKATGYSTLTEAMAFGLDL